MFIENIQTPNLILRKPILSDCNDWMWDNDPKVQKYLPEPRTFQTIGNQHEFFNEIEIEDDGWYWSIEDKKSKECIGIVSITEISEYHGIGEIGIVMGKPQYYGKGYATETISGILSFLKQHQKLRRVSAECELENVPMIKVLEKCGFIQEAILIESRIKGSKPIDTVRYFTLV